MPPKEYGCVHLHLHPSGTRVDVSMDRPCQGFELSPDEAEDFATEMMELADIAREELLRREIADNN